MFDRIKRKFLLRRAKMVVAPYAKFGVNCSPTGLFYNPIRGWNVDLFEIGKRQEDPIAWLKQDLVPLNTVEEDRARNTARVKALSERADTANLLFPNEWNRSVDELPWWKEVAPRDFFIVFNGKRYHWTDDGVLALERAVDEAIVASAMLKEDIRAYFERYLRSHKHNAREWIRDDRFVDREGNTVLLSGPAKLFAEEVISTLENIQCRRDAVVSIEIIHYCTYQRRRRSRSEDPSKTVFKASGHPADLLPKLIEQVEFLYREGWAYTLRHTTRWIQGEEILQQKTGLADKGEVLNAFRAMFGGYLRARQEWGVYVTPAITS